jgi:hypothetical protein
MMQLYWHGSYDISDSQGREYTTLSVGESTVKGKKPCNIRMELSAKCLLKGRDHFESELGILSSARQLIRVVLRLRKSSVGFWEASIDIYKDKIQE